MQATRQAEPLFKRVSARYCSKKECQQARKNHWERHKKRLDPDYRERRKQHHRVWLENNPGHSYQTTNRNLHPDYVAKNRLHQMVRNLLARKVTLGLDETDIVKTDALTS